MPVRFDDASFGGLLDSAAQALMYDPALIEARKARQQAAIAASTAQKERTAAVAQLRTTRAQTAAVKSAASQERVTADQAARAEAARRAKAATLLSEQHLATLTEKAGTQTARAGTTRDAADRARVQAVPQPAMQPPTKQATPSAPLPPVPDRSVPVSLSHLGADSMPADKPNLLQALASKIHVDPLHPQDMFQTPGERQAALVRRTAAEQADIARQYQEEHPAAATAMSAGKVALGVAIGTGIAAGIAALAGPKIESSMTSTEAAKVGAASYVGAIGLMLGGAAAIKAVRGDKA